MHEAKCVADDLKHCKSGAGFTALNALCGSLVAVQCFGCCATLSACVSFRTPSSPVVSADPLALHGWCPALDTSSLGLGLALGALDATTGCYKSKVV
jgi:hypothetical protein